MSYLKIVLEDNNIKKTVNSSLGDSQHFLNYLYLEINDYVSENIDQFVSDDIEQTRKNIINFSNLVTLECINILSSNYTQEYYQSAGTRVKEFGSSALKTLSNPVIKLLQTLNVGAWFGSSMFAGSSFATGGTYGATLGGTIGVAGFPALAASSFIILMTMTAFLIGLKLLSKKDSILVYKLNSTMKDLIRELRREGYSDVTIIDTKSNLVKGYSVEKFRNCSKNCSGDDKNCVFDCYFDILVRDEFPLLISAYREHLKGREINTKEIHSFLYLFNYPTGDRLQKPAENFSDAFVKVLSIFYKDNESKKRYWISELDKLVRQG